MASIMKRGTIWSCTCDYREWVHIVKASHTLESCLLNKLYDVYLEAELNSSPEALTYNTTLLRFQLARGCFLGCNKVYTV